MTDDLTREAEEYLAGCHPSYQNAEPGRMLRRLIARAKLADLVIQEDACLWYMEPHPPEGQCQNDAATSCRSDYETPPCRLCQARMDVKKADLENTT